MKLYLVSLQLILNDLSAVSDSSLVNGKSNHRAVPLGNATCKEKKLALLQHLMAVTQWYEIGYYRKNKL